jgi:pimeloyl-ACP methyl ester carboxylesterase
MITPRTSASSGARRRRRPGVTLAAASTLVLASMAPAPGAVAARPRPGPQKPTVVLVHGAWADASSWSEVVAALQEAGYPVHAVANPLRTLAGDAASVRSFLETLTGPVVLVGHSYGGAVITNAAAGNPDVTALVYVNAFAPDEGEAATALAGPDSALSADPATVFDLVPAAFPPSPETDLYLKRSTVFRSFADGLSDREKAAIAATQRPATVGALNEPSGPAAWRTIPSWYLVGTEDRIIPPAVQRAMAERAGATVAEFRAGHVGLLSDPRAVTRIVEQAATAGAR